MKKLLVICAVALGVAATSGQEASAWCNFKFGAGINISYTSAGNSLLWGLWCNGPYCGGCGFGYPGCCPDGYGDYSGALAYGGGYAPVAAAGAVAQPDNVQTVGYGQGGYYQPVGYTPSQVPSYWYGR